MSGWEESKITLHTAFDDLGADSLDLMEILMQVEEEFEIEIPDEEAEKITTLSEAVEIISDSLTTGSKDKIKATARPFTPKTDIDIFNQLEKIIVDVLDKEEDDSGKTHLDKEEDDSDKKGWWDKHPWLSDYLFILGIPAFVIWQSSSQGISIEEYVKNLYENKWNDLAGLLFLISLIIWVPFTIYNLLLALLSILARIEVPLQNIAYKFNIGVNKLWSGFSISKGQKQYRVYKNPQNIYQAVKVGWSFPAFFFEIFWCLVKKLWIYAGIIFFGWIFFFIIGEPIIEWIFYFGVMIWLGTQGNDLYAKSLQERGYDFLTTLSAKTPEGAIAQYQKDAQKDKED